jgi:hypothetical protein
MHARSSGSLQLLAMREATLRSRAANLCGAGGIGALTVTGLAKNPPDPSAIRTSSAIEVPDISEDVGQAMCTTVSAWSVRRHSASRLRPISFTSSGRH